MKNQPTNYWQKRWNNFRKKIIIVMSVSILIVLIGFVGKIQGKTTIQETLLQSIAGFIFWTTSLTPYMLFVVKTRGKQYWKWVMMQIVIVPPLAPLSVWFIDWFTKLNINFWLQ